MIRRQRWVASTQKKTLLSVLILHLLHLPLRHVDTKELIPFSVGNWLDWSTQLPIDNSWSIIW